jgi:hypothetical protein
LLIKLYNLSIYKEYKLYGQNILVALNHFFDIFRNLFNYNITKLELSRSDALNLRLNDTKITKQIFEIL